MNELRFTWDSDKNDTNIVKHGIDFQRVALVFKGEIVERIDDRRDYGELRMIALGQLNLTVYRVVYTEPEQGLIRIISAQKAERHEQEIYYRALYA